MNDCDDALNAALASLLAEGLHAVDLSPMQRASLFARVLARIADTPPESTETVRVATLAWVPVGPGVWTKVLKIDPAANRQVALYRLDAGALVPAHDHHQDEEWLVLQGEVMLGEHEVREGDFHFAHQGSRHPDLTTQNGALLLVRSEIPAAPTS